MKHENTWFHWERNSTLTPIYMCMDAWGMPTKKYWGIVWPTTIYIWKNDVISWNNKTSELEQMGKVMVDRLLDHGLQTFEQEVEASAGKIRYFLKTCSSKDISKLEQTELVSLFRELYDLYIHWFVLGVTEPPGIYGEKLIEKLSGDKKNFSLLTSPVRKSFSRRELEELLSVVSDQGLERVDRAGLGRIVDRDVHPATTRQLGHCMRSRAFGHIDSYISAHCLGSPQT